MGKWKSGWYFKKKDGQYATGFIQPNAEKRVYYLNNKGLMKTGWVKVKDLWYYANSNGSLHKGWLKWKGLWYYLDPKQAAYPAITGFFSDGKARYYCAPGSCAMKTGWIKNGEMTSCPPRQQDAKIKKLVRDLDKAQGYIN